MISPHAIEFVIIEIELATGKIDEAEALRRMAAVTDKALRYGRLMSALTFIVALAVCIGLPLFALRVYGLL